MEALDFQAPADSRMSAAAGIRFAPGPFKYNGRVAAALVPSLLVAAGLGGRGVMGIFTIGTMLWYIMDAMQYREGAFSVVGCTVLTQPAWLLPWQPNTAVYIPTVTAKAAAAPAALLAVLEASMYPCRPGCQSLLVYRG